VFNQNQGPIAEAKARRALAAAKFLQLQSQVSAQLDRAGAGWRTAQVQLKTSKALGEAVARQQNAILNQRAVGVASGRDRAAAEMEIDSIRLAQLDSLTQVDMAMGALEDAVQQPSKNLTLLKIVSSSSDRKSKP
jgi:cobalt-zinc-cadmium efflux system outer membrane protein